MGRYHQKILEDVSGGRQKGWLGGDHFSFGRKCRTKKKKKDGEKVH